MNSSAWMSTVYSTAYTDRMADTGLDTCTAVYSILYMPADSLSHTHMAVYSTSYTTAYNNTAV